MIRGIKLASIPVRNQDASLKFYTEKLGFKVATDQPFSEKQRWISCRFPAPTPALCCLLQTDMKAESAIFSR